jgi:hypothetical protein
MKLKQLKSCIDQCVKKAGKLNPDVEVWVGNSMYRIKRVGQFGVVPDVTLTVGRKVTELK